MSLAGRMDSADGADVLGLLTLLAGNDLKLHLLAFLEALEARAGDGAEVDEHVRAILTRDKTKTLGIIEPLHGTDWHLLFAFFRAVFTAP